VPSHEVAYTAGFFDGEGCVNIVRYLQRGRSYHTLQIVFTNTDFQALEWLRQRWGGYLSKPTQPSNPRHRSSRHLRMSAGPARPTAGRDAPLPDYQEVTSRNCVGVHRSQELQPRSARRSGRTCQEGRPGRQNAPAPRSIQRR